MRAYLIDATIRTITQFDYIDGYHSPSEIIGGKGRGNFALGSGPLTPRRTKEEEDEDYHLGDYLYAARGIHDDESSRSVKGTPVPSRACKVKGDPKFWFQIDADRERPSTFPIPGRGLVIGVTIDGGWIDTRLSLEELTARVTFTRRKFRGFQTSEAILEGEIWTGPVAPIIEEA